MSCSHVIRFGGNEICLDKLYRQREWPWPPPDDERRWALDEVFARTPGGPLDLAAARQRVWDFMQEDPEVIER